ncbi:hypothetical protein [Pseudomonas fluorescens]
MPRPLMLLVFIHKDLSDYKTGELFENHFNWLSDEFEALSGRPFAIIFIPPSAAPTLSDHSYKIGIPEQALYDWYLKVEEQKMTYTSGSYDDHTRKFLLLTRDNLNSSTAGIASPKGYCAISSIRSNQSPAHEVGHMFGATHEDYEVYYNGWWDETIMAPGTGFSALRGDAKRFSDKNRENIRNYLEEYA